jgi:purine-binding chemotaxis protein CheW
VENVHRKGGGVCMSVTQSKNQVEDIQIVVFKLGKELFASDIHPVKEIRRVDEITPVPQAPDFVEGIISLRGEIYPIIDLGIRFGKESREITNDSRIIVIDVPGSQYGMIVDSVMEVQRVKADNIEEAPELVVRGSQKFLQGVVKKEDQLILLVDVEKILTEGEKKELKEAEMA